MGKPYSMDLRKRAVAAVLRDGLSRHKSAAQFGVGISVVINWVRRFQDTGSVAPGQMGLAIWPTRPPKFSNDIAPTAPPA